MPPEWEQADLLHTSPPSSGMRLIDERYRVLGTVGEGTAGVVYRCRHSVVGRDVAIKILRQDFTQDESVRERFANEARAASEIGSPHIVETLDYGVLANGSTYLVMELLEGCTLGELYADRRLLPFETILALMRQVADGLGAAHDAGIVHRDVKPDNLFVTRVDGSEFVKILDFGVAKMASSQASLTRAGTVFGTPHYMSPEQAAGVPADERADIYSFGVILYELACGDVPFDAEAPLAILTQHMTESPVALTARLPPGRELPPGYAAVVHKCLEKDPDERYSSMRELGAELAEIQAGNVPRNSTSRPPPRLGLPGARVGSPTAVLIVLSAIAALVGLGVGFSLRGSTETSIDRVAQVPVPVAPSAPAPPAQEIAPTSLVQVNVDLVLFPLDAHVYLDERDLGPMPVSVSVPDGETVTVMVRRKDYVPRRIVLDGSESRVVVGLRHVTESDWYRRLKERDPATADPPRPAEPEPVETPAAEPAVGDEQAGAFSRTFALSPAPTLMPSLRLDRLPTLRPQVSSSAPSSSAPPSSAPPSASAEAQAAGQFAPNLKAPSSRPSPGRAGRGYAR